MIRVIVALLLLTGIITMQNLVAADMAIRSPHNPLITPASGSIGKNINGPSVIRVPRWLKGRRADYYMYFADHGGTYIRLATAMHPAGPWTVQDDRILSIKSLQGSRFHGHIASPDVHLDEKHKRILLYFHAPARWSQDYRPFIRSKFGQLTGVAAASDGVDFSLINEHPLSLSYLRVFTWNAKRYGLSARALVYREHEESWPRGTLPFEERVKPLGSWRHCTVHVEKNRLFVFYSRWGDKPERIVASYADLKDDWNDWELSPAVGILRPEGAIEGAHLPLKASKKGAARGPLHELRDPALFIDGKDTWLYYSIAGESGISVAKLAPDWQQRIVHAIDDGYVDRPDADKKRKKK